MRVRAIVLVIVVIAMAAALLWSQRRTTAPKISGFLEADDVRVGSRVGGRVATVKVREGQAVKTGDVLIELEPYDLAERRSEAEAQLNAKKADLERLKNGPRPQEIAAAAALLKQAEAQVELARVTLRRIRQSFERNAASADEVDTAVANQKATLASVEAREAELDLLKAGTRAEDIAAGEAAVKAAEAELAALDK